MSEISDSQTFKNLGVVVGGLVGVAVVLVLVAGAIASIVAV